VTAKCEAVAVDFQGKVALVTGGGGGIGSATAAHLAANGAVVVVNDVDQARIDAVVGLIHQAGGQAAAGKADITDEAAVAGLVGRIVDEHGAVDILVNNAGGAMPGAQWAAVESTSLADWESFIRLNLTAAFLCSRAVIPGMVAKGRGHIVSVGSISGTNGQRGGAGYAAAKAGLGALVASLAKEVGAQGVSVNGIVVGNAPFPTRSAERQGELDRAVHLARGGRTDEFAAAIAFLCSEDSSYMSGAMIPVDGGFHRSVLL